MAFDRQGTGLSVLRIMLGVFLVFQGISKFRWLLESSILLEQLRAWERVVAPGSIAGRYLRQVALPYASIFARLVPIGEIVCGLALIGGIWTRVFAFVAFIMVLNFQIAGGTIFTYGFLTNGFGLPVLGGTLALAIGAVRLPWSLR
jgi:uncharacterized membrane protein YphA (DoxX/SURF4 family)